MALQAELSEWFGARDVYTRLHEILERHPSELRGLKSLNFLVEGSPSAYFDVVRQKYTAADLHRWAPINKTILSDFVEEIYLYRLDPLTGQPLAAPSVAY